MDADRPTFVTTLTLPSPPAPPWRRLPSTVWLVCSVAITAGFVITEVVFSPAPVRLIAGVLGITAALTTVVFALRETGRYSRRAGSIANLILAATINPYFALGALVAAGVVSYD